MYYKQVTIKLCKNIYFKMISILTNQISLLHVALLKVADLRICHQTHFQPLSQLNQVTRHDRSKADVLDRTHFFLLFIK